MLLELFIMLEIIAFIMLLVSFINVNGYRNWLLSLIAFILFLFLSFQSWQIQTENCRSLVANSTAVTADVTNYEYTYDCQVNTFRDKTLSWVNISFAIISIFYCLGNIFIKNWGVFGV